MASRFSSACSYSQVLPRRNPFDFGLRIAWGGATAQTTAQFKVSDGDLSDPVRFALEADTPGSTLLEDNTLEIQQRSNRAYDGCEVTFRGPETASLQVVIQPNAAGEPYRAEIPVAKFLTEPHSAALNVGGRLYIRRAPGDELRIQHRRKSLVFWTSEVFEFDVVPSLYNLEPGTNVDCRLELIRSRASDVVWSEEFDLKVRDDGRLDRISEVTLPLPADEGAYDLRVSIGTRNFFKPFRRNVITRRSVQLVAVDAKATATEEVDWEEQVTIDPLNPGWWQRLAKLPHLKILPWPQEPPSAGENRVVRHGDQELTELAPGSWKAYPLPAEAVGRPHLVEIEYATDIPQTLAISIVQPNAAGAVLPMGLDSGVQVSKTSSDGKMAKHRLVFWPKTDTAWLLLVNRGTNGPAAYGKIRLFAGPESLPSSEVSTAKIDERMLAAYFDKPLFPENFAASEGLDEASQRSLDDWQTFLEGTDRLIQYLKHVGYNAAVISVVSEGSSIYPSDLLEPTPKYDNGLFFSTGQDPMRKDVLELMFRMFDREGIKLIPAVQFASPLPRLEQQVRQAGIRSNPFELIDFQGRPWLAQEGTRRGLAPFYNPLLPPVQSAMLEVIDELGRRYGKYDAFAGVSLQMGADTYAQMPSLRWGYDRNTILQFAEQTGWSRKSTFPRQWKDQVTNLRGRMREDWIAWRAEQLASFYVELQRNLAQHHTGAKLFLCGADLFSSREIGRLVRPTLAQASDTKKALLEMGLDPAMFRSNADIVITRPQRTAPTLSLWSQRVNLGMRDTADVNTTFGEAAHHASLFVQESLPMRLPSFDEQSPFGAERTKLWLESHVIPHAEENRRRFVHAISSTDTQTILDGGWMLPLGQEDAVRDLFDTFRHLPVERFETLPSSEESAGRHGVVVRRLIRGAKTYVYAVNDAPWPCQLTIELSATDDCRLEPLGSRVLPHLRREGRNWTWTVELKPYDLVGAAMTSPRVEFIDWNASIPRDVVPQLRQEIKQVRGLVTKLESPPQFKVLTNPGMEQPSERGVPGWVHAWGPRINIGTDGSQSRDGTRSLRVQNESDGDVAWIRSEPFAPPATGRISVFVWLRVDNPRHQPPLRLAIEGLLDGKPHYRYATVGRGSSAPPLKQSWEKYIFQVDDLPPGLTNLRVGFDLMGKGKVWIDDVKLYDRWLSEVEHDELVKRIALAAFQLDNGQTGSCQQFLDGYWSQFLRRHVESELVVARENNEGIRSARQPNETEQPSSPSMLDRVKGFVPKKVLPF